MALVRLAFADLLHRVIDDRQITQAKEVELKKTYALNVTLCKLNCDSVIVYCKRRDISNVFSGYDYSRSMRSGITRKTFNTHCHIDNLTRFRIGIVCFLKLCADLKRLL